MAPDRMPVSPDEAVRVVVRRLSGLAGTRWVAVDGFGGAGKSTLARRLADALPGSVLVPVDDFAGGEAPTWEHGRFSTEVLEPLLAGRPGRYRQRPPGGPPAGWVDVPVGVPVIVEGVSATDHAVAVPWDVRIWVAAPAGVRWARIAARGPDLLDRWRTDWLPSEQRYAAAQRPRERADLVVDGSGGPCPRAVGCS